MLGHGREYPVTLCLANEGSDQGGLADLSTVVGKVVDHLPCTRANRNIAYHYGDVAQDPRRKSAMAVQAIRKTMSLNGAIESCGDHAILPKPRVIIK